METVDAEAGVLDQPAGFLFRSGQVPHGLPASHTGRNPPDCRKDPPEEAAVNVGRGTQPKTSLSRPTVMPSSTAVPPSNRQVRRTSS